MKIILNLLVNVALAIVVYNLYGLGAMILVGVVIAWDHVMLDKIYRERNKPTPGHHSIIEERFVESGE